MDQNGNFLPGRNATNSLAPWLDPDETGAATLNTTPIPSIDGPEGFLCALSTFALGNVPPGTNVTWTAGPDSLFSQTSGTGATANIGPLNSHQRGHGTVTFHVETDCGTADISRTLWVGLPSFWEYKVNGEPFYLGSCHGVCPGFNQAEIAIGGLIEAFPANVDWQLMPPGW